MDAELFQEKMDPTHRMYLCRMLNVKELPEDLLERYSRVKSLVDRIDGHLTPGDLAMIIVSVGNNPEIATEMLDESDDNVVEEAVCNHEWEDHGIAARCRKCGVTNATEEVMKLVRKQPEPPVEKPSPKEDAPNIWSAGMPVQVLQDDELKQGNIVGIVRPAEGSKRPLQITVEFEGGKTETFDEDEVDAI
jgi:hypothetical protein